MKQLCLQTFCLIQAYDGSEHLRAVSLHVSQVLFIRDMGLDGTLLQGTQFTVGFELGEGLGAVEGEEEGSLEVVGETEGDEDGMSEGMSLGADVGGSARLNTISLHSILFFSRSSNLRVTVASPNGPSSSKSTEATKYPFPVLSRSPLIVSEENSISYSLFFILFTSILSLYANMWSVSVEEMVVVLFSSGRKSRARK